MMTEDSDALRQDFIAELVIQQQRRVRQARLKQGLAIAITVAALAAITLAVLR
jgi:hypothetical protein